jgi:hypothetical protein
VDDQQHPLPHAHAVLPIDYAASDDEARTLRPIGWLAIAFAGAALVELSAGIIVAVFSSRFTTSEWRNFFMFGFLAVRVPLLIWVLVAARALVQGNATAREPLRSACLLNAVLMLAVAAVGVVIGMSYLQAAGAGFWAQLALTCLHNLLEMAFPLAFWWVLRADRGTRTISN